MIRHIVILRSAPDVPEQRLLDILDRLRGLVDSLPGMLDFHSGSNVNTLPDLDQGFSHAFTIDFADESTRDAYYASTDHIWVAEQLQPLLANGLADLLMFQIEL